MAVTDFAEFAPDLPPLGRTTDHVLNAFPLSNGIYAAVPALSQTGDDGLDARCQGAASFVGSDGTVVTFAGDVSKLYLWDGDMWGDVSQAATTYATPSDGRWSFSQFGDFVIADNGVDDPQVWEIGTSTEWADLAGNPDPARYNHTIRDFSFRGFLSTDPFAIQWSSQFDHTEWTPGTNSGDIQTFLTGGRVTGLAGDQYVVVFQEHAIRLGQFVGPDLIFQFDAVSTERGCTVPGSIVEIQQIVFFLDHDGFYRLDGGQVITPIGDGKVDLWFWDNVNRSFTNRISAMIDPRRKLYMLSFPSADSADGTPDYTLVYNWISQRWSLLDVAGDALSLLTVERSVTMEDLDTLYPSGVEDVDVSFDSDEFLATGIGRMAMFDTAFFVNFFNGSPLDAELDTVETQNGSMRQSEIDRLRAMIAGGDDTTTISAQLGYRDRQVDALTFSPEVEQDDLGDIYFCEPAAWYQRARIKVTGTWTKAQGVEFMATDGGDG